MYLTANCVCFFSAIHPIITIKSNKIFNTENGLKSTNHGTRLVEVLVFPKRSAKLIEGSEECKC